MENALTFPWRLVYCYGLPDNNPGPERVASYSTAKEVWGAFTEEECIDVSEMAIQMETETVSAIFTARIGAGGEVLEQSKIA